MYSNVVLISETGLSHNICQQKLNTHFYFVLWSDVYTFSISYFLTRTLKYYTNFLFRTVYYSPSAGLKRLQTQHSRINHFTRPRKTVSKRLTDKVTLSTAPRWYHQRARSSIIDRSMSMYGLLGWVQLQVGVTLQPDRLCVKWFPTAFDDILAGTPISTVYDRFQHLSTYHVKNTGFFNLTVRYNFFDIWPHVHE